MTIRNANTSTWIARDVLGYDIPAPVQHEAARFVVDVLSTIADRAEITVHYPGARADVIGVIVPRTRLNIRWKGERPSILHIVAGLGVVVGVDPHHGAQAAVAGAAINFLPQLRRLSDEQLEVMLKLQRLTQGSVYRQGASIHELRGCWPPDSSSTIDELVDDLVLAGVLYRRGDNVVAHL